MTAANYPDLLAALTEIVDEICGSATAEKVTLDATFDAELQIDSLTMVEIVVACDVDNPLCGPRGASAVFGPQKFNPARPQLFYGPGAGVAPTASAVLGDLVTVARNRLSDTRGVFDVGQALGAEVGVVQLGVVAALGQQIWLDNLSGELVSGGALAAWIADPQHIKPGAKMPAHALAPADMQALLAYLGSLQ